MGAVTGTISGIGAAATYSIKNNRNFLTGKPVWPKNNGALGGENMTTLQPGAKIDRYGLPKGKFASPEGTPFSERSLPAENIELPLNSYEVVKPISVHESIIAPWFDQSGYGIQYRFNNSIQYYLDNGFLK